MFVCIRKTICKGQGVKSFKYSIEYSISELLFNSKVWRGVSKGRDADPSIGYARSLAPKIDYWFSVCRNGYNSWHQEN